MKNDERKKKSKRYILLLLLLSLILFLFLNYFDEINLGEYIPGKQQVESVETKGSEISIRGYQLYDNYDMSETDNVEHVLFFKGATDSEIPVVNEKREDITELFKDYKTNYDYAGYQTVEGFYDISSIKEGKYVLNIRTKIIDNDIDLHQKATLDGEWEDQDLSKDLVGGFIYHFYVLDGEIHLEKVAPDFATQQKVEELTTKGSEISIKGFQLYEAYDMSKIDNVEHTMFFQETTLGKQHPIMIDTTKRIDITKKLAKDDANYDYAGYQTDGFYNVDSIPNGNYVLKIRTKLLDAEIDETQNAALNMYNQDLTKHATDGSTYRFYIQEQKFYLEKTTTTRPARQEIEKIATKGSSINIEGFQLYEYYDMSSAKDIKHNIFFQEVKTNEKFQIQTTTTSRPDVTSRYESHGMNYDYSGYESKGGFYDVQAIEEGKYELKIRTQILSENLDKTQVSTFNSKNKTLSKNEHKGFSYHFYILNNKVYLEKKLAVTTAHQEVESLDVQGAKINIEGYQLYEYYDMSVDANVKQTLFFEEINTNKKHQINITTKKRTDITTLFESHSTNYDYSGYATNGYYDLESIPNGEYKLKIRLQILTQNLDETANAKHKNIKNENISKHSVNGHTYYFYIRNNDIYLEKEPTVLTVQQEVESVNTQAGQIEITGFQLYEYADMSSASNVAQSMLFINTANQTQHTWPIASKERTDFSKLSKYHGANYDYSGYESAGMVDVSMIPNGTYELNIKTEITTDGIDEIQIATFNEADQNLSKTQINYDEYYFYVEDKKIYFQKSTPPISNNQTVEDVKTTKATLEFEGFQLYEYFDMSVESNVEHELFFEETQSGAKHALDTTKKTDVEHVLNTNNKKRTDITDQYPEHNTNYDYAGYETAGVLDISSIPIGEYSLKIRTSIIDQALTKTQNTETNLLDQTISNDATNGYIYHFFVINNEIFLEKTIAPVDAIQEFEVIDVFESKINISGFQLFEYYDMGDELNIKHDLAFVDTTSGIEHSIGTESVERTDITAFYSMHSTNYDYSGYQTTGGTFFDTKLMPAGTYELYINTEIVDLNVIQAEKAKANANLIDQILSDEKRSGFHYIFSIENNILKFEKIPIAITTHQEVETVIAQDSEISIRGYQLYEYYEMDNVADIQHDIIFKNVNISNEYTIGLDKVLRTDITNQFSSHKTNYDYAGFETSGFYDMAVIDEGTYEVNIRTQILDEGFDTTQVAITNLNDQILSEQALNGIMYTFSILNNNIYVKKEILPLTTQQEVEFFDANLSSINVTGFQLYEYYDMSVQTNIQHDLFFEETTTGTKYSIPIDIDYRTDLTTNNMAHKTNYDYAGYEITGGTNINIRAIPPGIHELKIKTKIIDQAINETQAVTYALTNQTISNANTNGFSYHFYVQANKIYLEKTRLATTNQQEVEIATSSNSGIYLKGYQLYDYYDMGDMVDVEHEMIFKDTTSPTEHTVVLDTKQRTDITANHPNHHTNYDYAGFETVGGSQANFSHVAEGLYELNIRTKILDEGVDETAIATFNVSDRTLSNHNFLGYFYHFYVNNNTIYLEKTKQPLTPRFGSTTTSTSGNRHLTIRGYHFYEYYPLANSGDVTHSLVFRNKSWPHQEASIPTITEHRPDVTAMFPHQTNYDYSGFSTDGPYDLAAVPTNPDPLGSNYTFALWIKIEDHANGHTRYVLYHHPQRYGTISDGPGGDGWDYLLQMSDHRVELIKH